MTQLSEFQTRACLVALTKMFNGRHFSICTISDVAKTMGIEGRCSGRDWSALHALHCIDWSDMGPELSQQVRETCMRFLSLEPIEIQLQRPGQPAKSSLLRIAAGGRF